MVKIRSKEKYEEAVKNSLSIAGMCRYLGIKVVGSNYRTIHKAIKNFNLDTSHFTGQGWNVGDRYSPVIKKFPLEKVLVKNSTYTSYNLRPRLINSGLKKHECERCKLSLWLDKPIPLELHHKDGDNTNNELDNLELLCPNCHALTDNYRGRNKQAPVVEWNTQNT